MYPGKLCYPPLGWPYNPDVVSRVCMGCECEHCYYVRASPDGCKHAGIHQDVKHRFGSPLPPALLTIGWHRDLQVGRHAGGFGGDGRHAVVLLGGGPKIELLRDLDRVTQ